MVTGGHGHTDEGEADLFKGRNKSLQQSGGIYERVISGINTIRVIQSFCLYIILRLCAGKFCLNNIGHCFVQYVSECTLHQSNCSETLLEFLHYGVR